ncbi:MAG: LysR family transcriptional regulator [Verrucomicrobia bacterium]|nr:LysR family transcriptional regulator [Verrucomicrobiota bacterium]
MDAHLLPDILVFLNVARCGSITKAAERLNMVQSNVTARIKKLEDALGVTLLRRHARGVKLASAGEAVLPMAMRLDAVLNDLGYAFGRGKPSKEASLRVGAIETVAAVQLPGLVSRFLEKSPHVDVSVHVGSSSNLVDQVKRGELDAGFVSRSFAAPGLREELVFTDKLVALAPLKVKTRDDLFAVNRTGLKVLVQRLGCSYTERLLTFLETKKVRPERIMEMGTLEGVLGFVEAGVGIAAMPESFIGPMSQGRKVVMISLPKDVAALRTYVLSSQHTASPLVNDFVDQCCPVRTKRCQGENLGAVRA